jgi:hypothetical protein
VLAAAPEPEKMYWAAATPEMWWVAALELESCMMFPWWLQRSANSATSSVVSGA